MRATERRIVVCAAEDLPVGACRIIRRGSLSIGVLNVGGDVVAFHNRCPHQGAPIACGVLTTSAVDVDVIGYGYGNAVDVLRCPWHGWEFDVRTGTALADGRYRLRMYAVQLEDGSVIVDLNTRSDPPPAA